MKILVIGSGGREHALVWKISQSKLVDKIFCAPGNGGILKHAECIDIKTEDTDGLLELVRKERIDFTIVGPEASLAQGISDEFMKNGFKIFGPGKLAASLESSKIFAKELMHKYSVPTADFKIFDNPDDAKHYIETKNGPWVIKADGLAQGKGVFVVKTEEEAFNAIDLVMVNKIFGKAGERIIVEDFLKGEEASIVVVTDSREFVAFPSSQDHKRVFDNDEGPNTGGMGAYSPAPVVTRELFEVIEKDIITRTIDGLVQEGIIYKGVLYAGIMVTQQGPKVLEFNVRFGDPETQAVLPRLNSDLLELMLATSEGKLAKFKKFGSLNWNKKSCVCVVCASKGYPGDYEKDKVIYGLEEAEKLEDIVIFHAGTKVQISEEKDKKLDMKYMTNGGRVLGVVGLGEGIEEAIRRTYRAVEKIHFEGMHYRKDIGKKALENKKSHHKNCATRINEVA
ncbi:MAG: phosphoribosylamine--glycine ligase [Candidatus Omnitrophica bacterium]|nr:phosphoribosylamine--glycine ligase [Candidatus Omnitrophota bacterium]